MQLSREFRQSKFPEEAGRYPKKPFSYPTILGPHTVDVLLLLPTAHGRRRLPCPQKASAELLHRLLPEHKKQQLVSIAYVLSLDSDDDCYYMPRYTWHEFLVSLRVAMPVYHRHGRLKV